MENVRNREIDSIKTGFWQMVSPSFYLFLSNQIQNPKTNLTGAGCWKLQTAKCKAHILSKICRPGLYHNFINLSDCKSVGSRIIVKVWEVKPTFLQAKELQGGFVKTQLGWSYACNLVGRPPVWIWKMPIFRYLIFWNVISRSLGQSLSLVFLPVRIGRNSDSTEFTRPLSGSVRLINRHCPGTVTIATSSSLSLVLSYILPQIVIVQDKTMI